MPVQRRAVPCMHERAGARCVHAPSLPTGPNPACRFCGEELLAALNLLVVGAARSQGLM